MNTMNDLKFDTVEVAKATKIAPLTAYTFLGGEFGHKVEVVSELGQNDGQTEEVLQEIARRWNAYQELVEFVSAFVDDIDHKAGESGDDATSFDCRYDAARKLLNTITQ